MSHVSERDNLERDQMDVTRQLAVLEGAYSNLQKERDDLVKEVSSGNCAWMFADFSWCEKTILSLETKMLIHNALPADKCLTLLYQAVADIAEAEYTSCWQVSDSPLSPTCQQLLTLLKQNTLPVDKSLTLLYQAVIDIAEAEYTSCWQVSDTPLPSSRWRCWIRIHFLLAVVWLSSLPSCQQPSSRWCCSIRIHFLLSSVWHSSTMQSLMLLNQNTLPVNKCLTLLSPPAVSSQAVADVTEAGQGVPEPPADWISQSLHLRWGKDPAVVTATGGCQAGQGGDVWEICCIQVQLLCAF